jgi:hypothetical protein
MLSWSIGCNEHDDLDGIVDKHFAWRASFFEQILQMSSFETEDRAGG